MLGVLGQATMHAIYLRSPQRVKLGLQMGKINPCTAKSSWGLDSVGSHVKLLYEVWLSTI